MSVESEPWAWLKDKKVGPPAWWLVKVQQVQWRWGLHSGSPHHQPLTSDCSLLLGGGGAWLKEAISTLRALHHRGQNLLPAPPPHPPSPPAGWSWINLLQLHFCNNWKLELEQSENLPVCLRPNIRAQLRRKQGSCFSIWWMFAAVGLIAAGQQQQQKKKKKRRRRSCENWSWWRPTTEATEASEPLETLGFFQTES